MERRRFVKGTGLASVLAAGMAPAVVSAQGNIRWRLASSFPKSLDTLYGSAEIFAKKVSDMTSGRFQISVHPAGEIMPAFGVVDALQANSVEVAHTASFYFTGKNEAFAFGTSIPFGLNSRQMTAWMYEGSGKRLMREFYAGYNIINFPGGNSGTQMGGWFRKELRSIADMRGLKMRIGTFTAPIMARMGVLPQNIPAGEIFAAMQKGTIDAVEWIGPYDDIKLGLNKVATNYYYPGWWEGGTELDFFVNIKAFSALSTEYKTIVEVAAAHAHVVTQAKYDAQNPIALKQMLAGGTKLAPFPQDIMNASFRAANEYYAELSAKNPTWKKIYTEYAKFRADQVLWFRIAEASFDRFMQAQRLSS